MDSAIVENGLPVNEVYRPVPGRVPHIPTEARYLELHAASLRPDFWAAAAVEYLDWSVPFRSVGGESFDDLAWFKGGKLNACYNAVDRWADAFPNRTAVIAEGDDSVASLTFSELRKKVCKVANMLKIDGGCRKGDIVTIYMPTVCELLVTMLACARIGAVHSVVFAGFSAPNLRERIMDANSRIVVCSLGSFRGGKEIRLLPIVEEAVVGLSCVKKVFVFGGAEGLSAPFAAASHENHRPYCPIEEMDAEDLLFLLYTSGSTGKPKGIAHTTGGYLVYAAMTHKLIFDVCETDIWACMADLGWITGHTYGVYGPLVNGNSTFLFDSIPTYPGPDRYWQMVARHKITHFYTAPTALRTLMKFGDEIVHKHDLSSLHVLGSVGEPINPEAWRWYYSVVGGGRCPIMDTYWQTETGGIVVSPLACRVLKPGSATLPFLGIDPLIVDPISGRELFGTNVAGYLAFRRPWPGMLRTILGDHLRMEASYFIQLGTEGGRVFLTGDGCVRDHDGYLWITGRVDDVIKVSGHRMGSAEIEHALGQHASVSESAVVGFPHPVKGEALFCFVVLRLGHETQPTLIQSLKNQVRKSIGPVATPDIIVVCGGLPKTRSGKIMRRILRKIAHGQSDQLGDVSTLADPTVVVELVGSAAAALDTYSATR